MALTLCASVALATPREKRSKVPDPVTWGHKKFRYDQAIGYYELYLKRAPQDDSDRTTFLDAFSTFFCGPLSGVKAIFWSGLGGSSQPGVYRKTAVDEAEPLYGR